MVGSGPFILERYVIGQRYELKRNPYFSMVDARGQRLPYLDRITISIVPEQNTEIMKFLGGELDLLDVKSVRGQDANMLKHKEKSLDFTLYNLGPDDGTYFLLFNISRRKNPKTGKYFVDPVKAAWFNDFRLPPGDKSCHQPTQRHQQRPQRRGLSALYMRNSGQSLF